MDYLIMLLKVFKYTQINTYLICSQNIPKENIKIWKKKINNKHLI